MIEELLASAGGQAQDLLALAVSGNATMINLLLQVPPDTIRRAPHIPPISQPPVLTAGELGLRGHPQAAVYCAPAINGYVGGDISAGIRPPACTPPRSSPSWWTSAPTARLCWATASG